MSFPQLLLHHNCRGVGLHLCVCVGGGGGSGVEPVTWGNGVCVQAEFVGRLGRDLLQRWRLLEKPV